MWPYWQSSLGWTRPWGGSGPIADPAPWPYATGINYAGPWAAAQTHWAPPTWGGGGPSVDPAPWPDAARFEASAAYPAAAYAGPAYRAPFFPTPGDPPVSPWAWFPRPRPQPFPFPWPRPGDPGPEDWAFTRPRFPFPFPGPEPGDPGPADLGFQTRNFAQSLESILRAGGLGDEQIARATVADLVAAYRASITPPVAKAAVGAFSAAQVAALDKNGLERLALLITSEGDRLGSLKQVVEARLKESKK